jgi:hypothetical protein
VSKSKRRSSAVVLVVLGLATAWILRGAQRIEPLGIEPLGILSLGTVQAEEDEETRSATKIRPQASRRGEVLAISTGEELLLGLLQVFADASGETIIVAAGIPGDERIAIEDEFESNDGAALETALDKAGFVMSRGRHDGALSLFVARKLDAAARKRGRFVRREETPAAAESQPEDPGAEGTANSTLDPQRAQGGLADTTSDGRARAPRGAIEVNGVRSGPRRIDAIERDGVRVFEQIDGDARRFLVTFETESKEEAETIARTVSAILASEEAKRAEKR